MAKLPRHLAHTVAAISVAAGVAGCSAGSGDTPPEPASTKVPTSAGRGGEDRTFDDGTYTAKGWYGGGPSSIDVTVTLADEQVTDVRVETNATDPTSLDYQQRFAAAVPAEVVGRPVEEVQVSRLAGSSGTPDGFNDALVKIRSQASR